MKLLLALLLLVGITGDTNEMRWRLSGNTWDVAPSLEQLLIQADAAWPIRHPADGTLGNASHSSRRSDHNPDSNGIVRAADIGEVTEDDAFALAEAIRLSKDPRIKYVIHERRMYSSYNHSEGRAWTWRYYNGTNGHWSHVHISVLESNQNDTSPWDIGAEGTDMPLNQVERAVVDIAFALGAAGNPEYWYSLENDDPEFEDLRKAITRFAPDDHEHSTSPVLPHEHTAYTTVGQAVPG